MTNSLLNRSGVFVAAADIKLYTNGQRVTASGGSDAAGSTSRIGWDGSTTQYHHGFIAEVIIFDNIISEANRLLLEEWLAYKWAVPGYQRT